MKRMTMIVAGCLGLALAAGAAEWKLVPGPLTTRWAKQVDPARPLPEHPRPQMVREAWLNLNGLWQFELTEKGAAQPAAFARTILVPFPVESALSGLRLRVEPKQRMWYRRTFTVPEAWRRGRVLAHFTVVDWDTQVLVNGRDVGRHVGGYDAFSFDITDALKPDAEQELVVSVWDPTNEGGQPIGKQTLHPGGIFYTPSSGIWGTVWLESVPKTYIRKFTLTPDIDAGVLKLTVEADGGKVRAVARDGGKTVGEAKGAPGDELTLRIPDAKLWSPDTPFLYDLDLELADGGTTDAVRSYFGMRKISIGPDEKGITRILLNNRFVLQKGPLDQGFWPEGLHTAPTDEALKFDVETTRAYGFNMSRKHTKVEPSRWYYWCDKLGIVVWQDMAGMPGRGEDKTPEQRKQFELELQRMVASLRNHPSIIMWVVFNEGWGQYDTERLVEQVRQWDPQRLVSNASGWVDKKVGDILDHHTYPVPGGPKPEPKRAAVVGEYGGLGFNMKGRMWAGDGWGYQTFTDEESLNARYEEITGVLLERAQDPGISAGVYTQVSDIEMENNGLMTYDREVFKIKPEVSARAMKGLLPPRKLSPADLFIDTGVVELKAASDQGRIVYTLDGSEPTAKADAYAQPLRIEKDTVIKARTVWPDGELSRVVAFPMKKTVARPAVAAPNAVPGLQVAAYELKDRVSTLPDFTALQPAKTSVAARVNLEPKPRNDNFGLVFTGFLNVPAAGVYLLRVASDDGAQVLIGGEPVCGRDGIHGMEESTGTVALAAGAHPFTVRFFQGVGGVGLHLDWLEPNGKFREIPATAFSHTGP